MEDLGENHNHDLFIFSPCGRKSLSEVLVNKLPNLATLCPRADSLPCFITLLVPFHDSSPCIPRTGQVPCQSKTALSATAYSANPPCLPTSLRHWTQALPVWTVIPMCNSRHYLRGSVTRTFKKYLADSRLLKERPVNCKVPVSCWI